MDPIIRGIELFNSEKYFEAHLEWEKIWKQDENFFKGLIQVAGGLYHWKNKNKKSAIFLLEKGKKYLEKYPYKYKKIKLKKFLHMLSKIILKMKNNQEFSFPKIEYLKNEIKNKRYSKSKS